MRPKRPEWIVTVVAAAVTVLSGCASTPPAGGPADEAPQRDAVQRTFEQSLERPERRETPTEGDTPSAVSEALLPPIDTGAAADDSSDIERRFDIQVQNARAREFFMSLVEDTPYNMVVHPAVTGEVSLTLKDVTIPEVMGVMRDVYGYEFQRTRSGFQVLPARLQSRIFQVNYLDIKRKGKSETRVSSGQVSEAALNQSDSGGSSAASGGTQQIGGEGGSRTVLGSRIETESETDFWNSLASSITAIIGSEGGRSVVTSPQSSLVVVRAMPGELREVRQFLGAMQGNLHRQVILEAKILEVELSEGFQSGINWAQLGTHNGDRGLIGQTGGGTVFDTGQSDIAGQARRLEDGTSITDGIDASAFGGVFSAALNIGNFNAFIELLETQGDVNVLSSPRVSTVNNQKAVIKVGSDEFFVTDVSSTTVTGTTTTTSPDIALTPFFSGIALDVTPQISRDGEVILHVHPSVSEVTDQTKQIKVAGQEQELPLAFSTVRESDSIVRAQSNQVVVIGGLMQNESENETASTPLLSEIPILGHLFQHRKTSSTKSELVILLRPIVVESDRQWANAIGESARRINRMRGDSGASTGGRIDIAPTQP